MRTVRVCFGAVFVRVGCGVPLALAVCERAAEDFLRGGPVVAGCAGGVGFFGGMVVGGCVGVVGCY